jgi:diguanylate cyclase (GGDEF)-like protein
LSGPAVDFSLVSLALQWIGTLVILGLLFFLTQSIRRRSLDYWALAWCCLTLALCLLNLDFRYPAPRHLLRAGYFLAEYGFGFLLVAGCREFARGAQPAGDGREGTRRLRKVLLWLPILVAVALSLTWLSEDFNAQFAAHAAILAVFFLAAFFALRPAHGRQRGPGLTVMSAALFLLALDFFHYVPVFVLAARLGYPRRFAYLNFTSSIDLTLETVLAFGMVMLTMESLRQEAETANRELKEALDRLESLARTDALTSALNRHAYYSLVGGRLGAPGVPAGAWAGCVAIVDLNHLKLINDREGHLAGDRAIRQVATAIRSVIRADDLLFRWGGDEFLVILDRLDEEEARRRFAAMNARLGAGEPGGCRLSVSFGVAAFGQAAGIEEAIARADEQMYLGKGRAAGRH